MNDGILTNEIVLFYLSVFALASFIFTLVVMPWLILLIPEDYFSEPERRSLLSNLPHPIYRPLVLVLKNLVGVILLLLGIVLLVLPGQGLLTMLVGLMMIDFPGKYRLERWLVSKRSVLLSINWLRRKGKKAPLIL